MVDNQSNGGAMSVNRSVVRSVDRSVVNPVISAIRRHFTTLTAAGSQHYTLPNFGTVSNAVIEAEFSTTDSSGDLFFVVGRHSSDRFYLGTQNGNLFIGTGLSTAELPVAVADGKLHTARLEVVGSNIVTTLNGIQVDSRLNTFSGDLDTIGIGYRADTVFNFFNGIIDNVRVMDSFYKIDEDWTGPSTFLADSSGNNQHGTAVNITSADAELFTQQSNRDWVNAFWPNLITFSNLFSDTAWAKTRLTVSGPTLTSTDNAESYIQQNASVSSDTFVLSCEIKKGTTDFAHFLAWNGSTSGVRGWFNLDTGTVGADTTFGTGWSVLSQSITPTGDGFFRCAVVVSKTGNLDSVRISPSDSNGSISSVVGASIEIKNYQLEDGAVLTSYVETTDEIGKRLEKA